MNAILYTEPEVDPQQDVTIIDSSSSNGVFSYSLKRKLITGDSNDYEISVDPRFPQFWVFAYSSTKPSGTTVQLHDERFAPSTPFNLVSITSSAWTKDSIMVLSHGLIMITVWSVAIPISLIAARFGKELFHDSWLNIHRGFVMFGVLLMICSLVLIFYTRPFDFELHQTLGILTVALTVILQIPLGIYIDKAYNPQRTSIPARDKAHWWIGRILFLAASVTIPTGIWAFENGGVSVFKIVWFIWQFLVIPVIFLICYLRVRRKDLQAVKKS